MNKQRVNVISAFEVFLCLFVIFIHLSSEGVTYGNKAGLFAGIMFILNKSVSFVVPAFIFASALKLTLKYKDTPVTLKYFIGRITKIYLPYVIWVVIYYAFFILIHYEDFNPYTLAAYILNGTLVAHFYFIVAIMQFYILMPLFLYIAKKIPALIGLAGAFVVTLSFIFFTFKNSFVFSFLPGDRWFLAYLIFWMMGVYFALNFKAFTDFLHNHKVIVWISCAFILITHIALSYANYIGSYIYNAYAAQTMHMIFCMALPCGFYALCMQYTEPYQKFFRSIGKTTYYVYLSHLLVQFIVENFLLKPDYWLVLRFLIKSVFVYTIPFAGAYIYILLKKKLFGKKEAI